MARTAPPTVSAWLLAAHLVTLVALAGSVFYSKTEGLYLPASLSNFGGGIGVVGSLAAIALWRRIRRENLSLGTPRASAGLYAWSFALFSVLHLLSLSAAQLELGSRVATLLWYGAPVAAFGLLISRARVRCVAEDVGLFIRGYGLRDLAIGVVVGAVAVLVAMGAYVLLARAGTGALLSTSTPTPILRGLLWTPLVEELMYRGVFPRATRSSLSWRWALPVSAAVFACGHSNRDLWLVYFLAGICFGAARRWRKSLLPSIAAHATWNCVVFIAILRLGGHR
jgi:membrane protease YdiL (CAAX protease family)